MQWPRNCSRNFHKVTHSKVRLSHHYYANSFNKNIHEIKTRHVNLFPLLNPWKENEAGIFGFGSAFSAWQSGLEWVIKSFLLPVHDCIKWLRHMVICSNWFFKKIVSIANANRFLKILKSQFSYFFTNLLCGSICIHILPHQNWHLSKIL